MAAAGALFVLTGIDGSGKATQTELLVQRLRGEGREVAVFDFPRYEGGLFGRMAARYLRGEFGKASDVSPYLAALIYAGDRWETQEELVRRLAAGAIVVCNRYVADNMAHQGCKIKNAADRQRFFGWVEELEHTVLGLPHPDLNILLDVPVETAQALIGSKAERAYLKGQERDIHEQDAAHLRAARETYLQLASLYFNWVKIDCAPAGEMLSREEIAEKVWEPVKSHLR